MNFRGLEFGEFGLRCSRSTSVLATTSWHVRVAPALGAVPKYRSLSCTVWRCASPVVGRQASEALLSTNARR